MGKPDEGWTRVTAVSFLRTMGVRVVDEQDRNGKVTATIPVKPTSLRILGARDYLINKQRFTLQV